MTSTRSATPAARIFSRATAAYAASYSMVDGHVRVLGREPNGRVAAQGAYFEGVLEAEHAALQGEEFAVGRGQADIGQAAFVADAEGAG